VHETDKENGNKTTWNAIAPINVDGRKKTRSNTKPERERGMKETAKRVQKRPGNMPKSTRTGNEQ
jgi:hypothetical protein